jgi:two-component system, OmpR family, response regulator VicR
MNSAGLKVLVADDEPEVSALCLNELANYGITVYSARNGNEAISIFIEERPEIVVMKYDLPRKNGLDVAKEILAMRRSTKIVMFASNREALRRAEGTGVEILLVAPFSSTRLIGAILALVNTRSPIALIHR